MQWRKHLLWLVPLLVLDIFAAWRYFTCRRPPESMPPEESELASHAKTPPPSASMRLDFPTPQTNLLTPATTGVFQPTLSGRPESALYGSTRTRQKGRYWRAAFHEGIDIAPTQRDRHGKALDEIYAAAAGKLAYLNRVSGNSNYGKYLVLLHTDPIGEIYTLYAHLAETAAQLRIGQNIASGATLGRMGNTPAAIVPMAQAHLHFEVGFVLNSRFRDWYRRQKLKPDHGNFHGWNLYGIDPLAVMAAQHEQGTNFSFSAHLAKIPHAFEIVIKTDRLPDFFQRYPALWYGAPFSPPAIALKCSENGMPLQGRNAMPDEIKTLGGKPYMIPTVTDAIGRNGAGLITQKGESWRLTGAGEKWRGILLY